MTEQIVDGVYSAEVDTEGREIVPKTVTVPSEPVNVLWKKSSGQGHIIGQQEKTLTERFNEAYNEDAKREDEEFVKNLKRYHRRRFSDEW